MIIEITSDTVLWIIAVALVVLSVLLFLTLMALRVTAAIINTRLLELQKKIPKIPGVTGGAEGGADGGGFNIMSILGGVLGGGK
jgi:hypothetical protein